MPKIVGDIAVKVGADITNLTVGMNQASDKVRKFGSDAESMSDKMSAMAGKATIAFSAIAAGAATLGAAAQYVVDFSSEITRLSQVAGIGVERFQSLSYAAKQYGVDQEKLSDILKDTNDKFGDFLQTGAGPLADFFEQIAPKVGVTIDQFRALSGPDALQLYVSSLEKAGVNQKELTFYMEALASDATMLLPLLRNNATEMGNLEQAAKDLGIVIDADLISKSTRMGRVWDSLLTQMQAKFITFAATVMDGFDAIFGITEEGQIQVGMRKIDALVTERNALLDKVTKAKERGARAVAVGGPNTTTEVALLQAQLQAVEDEMNVENDAILRINEVIMKREEAKARIAALSVDGGGDTGGIGTGDTGGTKTDTLQSDLDALQQSLMTEQELVAEWYQKSLDTLIAAKEAEKITEEEYRLERERLEQEHQDRMARIKELANQASLQGVLGAGADILGAMGAFNEKALKISQAFAAAEAFVSTYKGAAKEMEKGVLGFATAAAVIAKGIAFVAAIKGVNAKTGSTSAAASASAPASAASAPNPLQVGLNTFGGGEYVRTSDLGSILTQLNDIAGDRGYTILTPVSA